MSNVPFSQMGDLFEQYESEYVSLIKSVERLISEVFSWF
jgi:hypothetical protein